MSRVKSKNTDIEKIVFSYLRHEKIYFQRNYSRVSGRPDIALPRQKKAIFIDGDFWHGWKFERIKGKLNPFWQQKIQANISRDIRNKKLLKTKGWMVLRVWEHDLVPRKRYTTLLKVKSFLVDTPRSK